MITDLHSFSKTVELLVFFVKLFDIITKSDSLNSLRLMLGINSLSLFLKLSKVLSSKEDINSLITNPTS